MASESPGIPSEELPLLQSTVGASFTGATTTSSAPIQQGTNHTVNSSTKDEGLISHDELKSVVDKISIVETNDSTIQNRIQILLVTANETEYDAALTFLDPVEGFTTLLKYHHVNTKIKKNAVYIFGKFGYFNAAVHLMTQQGPAAAQDVVTVAADCFGNNLDAIFAVGVACGVEDKCKMLDVLVSKTISSYTVARISNKRDDKSDDEYEIQNRSPSNMPVSSFLKTYFDQLPKWPGEKSIAAKLLNKPTQVSGNILSGNYLIDNAKFKQKLLKAFANDAIGIEMEGAGLFQDYSDTRHKIMVIKAVCDFGDGKKDKTYQPTAAMLAVECLKHCIGSSPILPQKLAAFCGNKKDEGLISHDELKNIVDKISIVETKDSTIQNRIQILLVTADETEYGAALTFLDPVEEFKTLLKYHHVNSRINKHAVYIFGKFGYFNAAVHLMTQQGPAAAQDVVTVAADCFGNNLDAIFAVGVACGVEGKSKMLDVLVSKTISSYTVARISNKRDDKSDDEYEIQNRLPINMPVSSFLKTYFDQLPKWPGENSIAAKLLNKPTQVSGNILSGNYLIDNTKFKQKLLKDFANNAIGIEMEGAGLFQDYPDTRHKIMVIKAVCDFGDGKKDKTYQPTAAMLAVECLKHCIGSSPNLPQKLAAFCGNKRATDSTDSVPDLLRPDLLRQTESDLPAPTNVRATVLTPYSIEINWDQLYDVTGYLICYNSNASNKRLLVNSGSATSLTVTNLEQNTQYTITVQANSSDNRMSVKSNEVSVTTYADVPSLAPQNVTVISTDPASLRVSWELPSEIYHNGQIIGHVIQYTRIGSNVMMNMDVDSGTTHTISGLAAYTEYSVKVAAKTVNGTGPSSELELQVSGENIPSEPCSLEVVSVTASSMTLQWMPPQTTNGVIEQYSIQYGETVINNFGNNSLNTMTGTVEGLSPDTEYVLQLRARTRVGPGPPGNMTIKTHLPAPTNVRATVLTPYSVEVNWDQLSDVNGYLICYNSNASNARILLSGGSATSLTLTNLEQNTQYTITVQANSSDNIMSVKSDEVSVTTYADVPSLAPQNVTVISNDPASLKVSWQLPSEIYHNGPIIGHAIQYTRIGSNDMMNMDVDSRTTHTILGLVACTEYSVRVAAKTVNGTGPFSEPELQVSEEDKRRFNPQTWKNIILIILFAFIVAFLAFLISWNKR